MKKSVLILALTISAAAFANDSVELSSFEKKVISYCPQKIADKYQEACSKNLIGITSELRDVMIFSQVQAEFRETTDQKELREDACEVVGNLADYYNDPTVDYDTVADAKASAQIFKELVRTSAYERSRINKAKSAFLKTLR